MKNQHGLADVAYQGLTPDKGFRREKKKKRQGDTWGKNHFEI